MRQLGMFAQMLNQAAPPPTAASAASATASASSASVMSSTSVPAASATASATASASASPTSAYTSSIDQAVRAISAGASSLPGAAGGASPAFPSLDPSMDALLNSLMADFNTPASSSTTASTTGSSGGSGASPSMDALIDRLMAQMLSKEYLYQPMKDIAAAYPAWLTEQGDRITAEQRTLTLVQSTLVVGGLVLLVLIAGIASLVTRQVVVPVRQAAEVAERFAHGHLSERMPVVGEDVTGNITLRDTLYMRPRQVNEITAYNGISPPDC